MGLLADAFGGSTVQTPFQPFFESAFGQANRLARSQLPAIQQIARPTAEALYGQGQGFLGELGEAGADLAGLIGPGFAGAQLAGLTSLLNQNLSENIFPAIGGQSGALGMRGSLGQRVAEGIAARGVGDTLFQQGGNLLQADLTRRTQGAAALGGIQNQANLGAIGSLPTLFGTRMGGFNAEFSPLLNLSSILGSPQSAMTSTPGLVSGITGGMANVGSLFGGIGQFLGN